MYLLSYYQEKGILPDNLYDNNIVVNYGKIDNLVKLQNNTYYKNIISEILENDKIKGKLITQFNLEEDFTREDIISLLYYFGYLTIASEDDMDIVFRIPNKVMKETYNNYFNKILRDYISIDTTRYEVCINEIVNNGTINEVTNYVSEILKGTSNRIFIKFDEKYIQLIYNDILRNTSKFRYKLEYENNNKYTDIFIFENREYMKTNIAIELKYIKKDDYSESKLEEKRLEALKEIEEFSNGLSNLIKYIVIFSVDEVKLIEEIK